MKRIYYIFVGFIVLLLGFFACEQKELFLHTPKGNIFVNVEIHWDSVPSNMLVLPKDMTVHWYPASSSIIASDMSVFGGQERLHADIFNVMCMDFNGPVTLSFRSNGTREDFEVYSSFKTGTYNAFVPPLPGGEVTVAEPYPYQFYIDSRSQIIDTKNLPEKDSTITVHFYPKNVLREFTFLVYDVIGAKHMINNSGAMSGMSGSYFPASEKLASTPSTILFSRVETIKDAQTSPRWTEAEKALFAAKNPNWESTDTLIGWTRDWAIGKFVTFGPLSRETFRFRLTVEALSKANNRYNGSWGYWKGQWESSVAAQIDGAMGKNGTWEEQLAWRQRNGGYDIILYNDYRLVIPDGEGPDCPDCPTDGGFTVKVDDWGPIINVPTGGSSGSSSSPQMRAAVNTYATIPDFVVNGIYRTDGSFIFNEQYVFKPENAIQQGIDIWNYYPKRYWPQTAGFVDFYAYAPAGLKNLVTGLNNNTSPPVIKYAMLSPEERDQPPCGTGEPCVTPMVMNQEDLLVARQVKETPPLLTDNVVHMNFYHAFSRVSVSAKAANPNNVGGFNDYRRIRVTRVDLRNLYTTGELTIDNNIPNAGNMPLPDAPLWQNPADVANYRFRLIGPVVTIEDQYTTLVNSNDWVFVIPQVTNNAAIYVEYDVYSYSLTSDDEQYLTSVTKLIPFNITFNIGRQYDLQITLDIP